MKKSIFVFPILLFTLTLFILTNIKANAAETLEMYFTQGGNRISSITLAPGESTTVDFYINVEGAQAKFAQTAIAGINLRNGKNTTTVKIASDMPAGHYYLVGSYNGYSVMIDLFVTEPPHTCVYSSSSILSNPSCFSEGVKKYSCTCGNSYTEAIPKIAHTYSSTVIVPTCSSKGYTKNTCSVCSYSYNSDETAKLPHTPKNLSGVLATCTSTGLTAGSKCSVCNETIVAQEVTPKLEHSYGSWNNLIAPTCTKEGKKQRICTLCNNVESITLEKAEHTIVTLPQKPATCTSTGLTIGSKCSVCNKIIVAQEVTPKVDHNYGNWNTIIAPTCTKEGKKQRICTLCNNVETVTLEKTEHNWNSTYTMDKKATCTVEGTKSIHCKDCTITKNSTNIPKSEHTVITLPQKTATCTSTGLTAGSKCSVCNEPIVAQEVTPKLAHNYGSWKTVSSSSCVREGKEQRLCSLCNNTETNTLEKIDHKEIAGKTQNAHSKCSVCNETLSTKHNFILNVEKDTSAEIYKYTCDCGYQYTKVIPISVCEHVDEDVNNLCDLCNENLLQETTTYYKDCEDCKGLGCKFYVEHIRPVQTVRKEMIFKTTYSFHIANYLFNNAIEDISLESTPKYKTHFLYNTCATCNGVGTLELTVEPDSLKTEEKKRTN